MNKRKALTPAQRQYITDESFYRVCVHENIMSRDIEQEHALYYQGRKIQEVFAVVPVRRIYNRNPKAEHKAFSQWVALWRLFFSEDEYKERMFAEYPKKDFFKEQALISERYRWKLDNMPTLKYRLDFFRIRNGAP